MGSLSQEKGADSVWRRRSSCELDSSSFSEMPLDQPIQNLKQFSYNEQVLSWVDSVDWLQWVIVQRLTVVEDHLDP